MLTMTYVLGGQEADISRYVDWSSVSLSESINIPAQLTFDAYNYDAGFPAPVQRAYVRLYSTRFNRSLFTGFVSSQPNVTFKSIRAPGIQLFQYKMICTSDEHLLNVKAVPFIPAFVNQTQGQVLAKLASTLCPGFFDTSMVGSGDIEPYFKYDPTQSWSELAKTFGDGSRYRYKVRDKQILFQPYGDGQLGIEYDEDKHDSTFDPSSNGMQTQVLAVPTVNDITIIGAAEAGNNREDFFIGDGFTGNFPLRHKVFRGSSTLLLSDNWTESEFDSQQWYTNDPADQFNLGAGALNIVSTFSLPLGQAYIQMNNALELAGGIDLEHGEFGWNDISEGIVGGLYEQSLETDEAYASGSCLGGFYISSPTGVVTSASGAAGVFMQPTWRGVAVGEPVVSQVNHTYVLQTVITAPTYTRYNRWYRSLGGNAYGGVETVVPGDVTFIVQDYDIAAATGFYYQPNITKVSVSESNLPAFCAYGLINNQQLNVTINYTVLALMIMGALSAYEGPSGLWQPTGLILPMLPPGGGGYVGPVAPWPSDASGNIYPLPLQRSDTPHQEVLGNGFELQSAQITSGTEADTLAFYGNSLPAAGTPIRFQSYESQAALSRLQSSGSIVEEAYIVGDDGVRSAIISDLSPLPRTSEDCDAAAQAYLDDRTAVFYNGTYNCTSYFFNGLSSDTQFWPTCGRYLYVNSPARGIHKQWMLVTQLTISVLDAVGNAQRSLAGGQVGEVLKFSIGFGADLHLEKVLHNFVDQTPTNILTNSDTAETLKPIYSYQVDNAYLPDLKSILVNPITDTEAQVTIYDSVSAALEIRLQDAHWGQGATPDYVGTVTGSTFTLVRQQFEQTWYMRFVDTAQGIYSRRSKVVRIYYPVTPLPPTLISADSATIQFDFNGDIRNVYGFELRQGVYDLDTHTWSPGAPIVQQPTESYGDLGIALTKTANTFPFSTNRRFYAYFFNHQWSYSEPTIVDIPAPQVTIEEGYRYGQSLNLLCTLPSRADLVKQVWQVATSPLFSSGSLVIDQTNYSAGSITVSVPASADLYARSVLFDSISSGSWSGTVHVPLGDLIASDYLAAQGSAPPIMTTSSGSLVSYISSTNVLEVDTQPFSVLYPNGQAWSVPAQRDIFNAAKDTGATLEAGLGYYFYLSMPSAAYADPAVYVDGPYANPSQAALAYTVADGRVQLSGGALTFYTSTTATGTGGGGGGGTSGGGTYCGVLSSRIKLADGSYKTLRDVEIGAVVDDGYGGYETVVGRKIIPNQRVRLLCAGGYKTRVADGHTFKLEYGWDSVVRIEEEHNTGTAWPLVATMDGMQQITSSHRYGVEDVCHLQLSGPRHTYVLDGFVTHNMLLKSENS
jgi:hypothetical protein